MLHPTYLLRPLLLLLQVGLELINYGKGGEDVFNSRPLLLHLQVGLELTKYGKVEDVLIFEVITPGYLPEEAVRIFVKFDRVEPATRALVDLQGRFFGGRQVRRGS
jgi:hypothetical protein